MLNSSEEIIMIYIKNIEEILKLGKGRLPLDIEQKLENIIYKSYEDLSKIINSSYLFDVKFNSDNDNG